MATAPKDSNQIPTWQGNSFLQPDTINTEEVRSDAGRLRDIPHTAQVQASPQVVSSTSEEMAAHSTALNRLLHAAADLEIAEKDERDALAKAETLTAVRQQCLRVRDDAKRALAAAGRSCRLAAEAHHAELLRQLAASTAALAASVAATTTSDDDDLRATPFDATASTSPSTVTAAATSTPATTTTSAITRISTTTSAAALSPAGVHPSGAGPPPSPSQPTGTSANLVSIVEAGATSTAAYPLPAGFPPIEVSGLPFVDARVEDVRQADGLDRLATEEISFAATRVLRFCSARESTAITVATVVARAATNSSGDFSCAVSKLVVALQRFHANNEHSWESSPSPIAASGMLAPFPFPHTTSSSPSPDHSRAPIVTAAIDSTGICSPQRVRCSSISRSHRTESSSSNVNSCSDDSAVTSAAHVHRRRRRDDHSDLRRPADTTTTATSSRSSHPHDDNYPHRTTPTVDVSGSRAHLSDINSTTTVGVISAPYSRCVGLAGRARLRHDDSRDRVCRDTTQDRLCRDDSGDRIRRDNIRDRPRGEGNRGQPRADGGRNRSRADNSGVKRRADNSRGQLANVDFWGRPRDERNRDGVRSGDTGERPRDDSNRKQPWRSIPRQQQRCGGNHNDDRPRANNGDRPRANNDDRPRANNGDRPRTDNNDRPRANNDDRPRANNNGGPRANNGDRPRANNDNRPRANNDDRPRANNDDRQRANNDDRQRANNDNRPRASNTNGDRPRDDTRDRHQQLGGGANGLVDHHINLKTDSGGTSVGNRGRRGHRWGVKDKVPASDSAVASFSGFGPGSGSGSSSNVPSSSKRAVLPSRLAITRPLQRPRCQVEDYPSSSSDSFDFVLSQPTLSSNAAAVASSLESTTRPLVISDAACAQRAMMDDAAAAVMETSSVHALEQAYVGIGMR